MKKQIKDDEKNIIDVLLSLQNNAFNSFSTRRHYEWRISISLWTASVVLLGFLLKGEITTISFWVKSGITLIVILLVLSHAMWMKGAGKRTRADIRVTYFW